MKSLVRSGLRVRVGVRGRSMAPTLVTGDVVVVQKVDASRLLGGDLAVFEAGGRLYAHRFACWRRGGDGRDFLQFVADAKPELDPPVLPGALLGRIVAIEPAGAQGDLDLDLGAAVTAPGFLLRAGELVWRGLAFGGWR